MPITFCLRPNNTAAALRICPKDTFPNGRTKDVVQQIRLRGYELLTLAANISCGSPFIAASVPPSAQKGE